jgi:hypothetical protein
MSGINGSGDEPQREACGRISDPCSQIETFRAKRTIRSRRDSASRCRAWRHRSQADDRFPSKPCASRQPIGPPLSLHSSRPHDG